MTAALRRRSGKDNEPVRAEPMSTAEIAIALVVAAHAAVLAVRLSVSLYRA